MQAVCVCVCVCGWVLREEDGVRGVLDAHHIQVVPPLFCGFLTSTKQILSSNIII
jgi:hypothetical protein